MGKSFEDNNIMQASDQQQLRRQHDRSRSPSTGGAARKPPSTSTAREPSQRNSRSSDRRRSSGSNVGGVTTINSSARRRQQHRNKTTNHNSKIQQSPSQRHISRLIRSALNDNNDDDDSSRSHDSSDSSSHQSSSEESRNNGSTSDDSDDEELAALMNLYPVSAPTTASSAESGASSEEELDYAKLLAHVDFDEDDEESPHTRNKKNSLQSKNKNMISMTALARRSDESSSSDDSSNSSTHSSPNDSSYDDAISAHGSVSEEEDDGYDGFEKFVPSPKTTTRDEDISQNTRKIRFISKGAHHQQQKDEASGSTNSDPFQVTTVTGNISTWEMREKFKKEFPTEPVPSDDILRQLYRTEKVVEYERQERFKRENPGQRVPSDLVLKKLYSKTSTASSPSMVDRALPPASSDAIDYFTTDESIDELSSPKPIQRTDLLKRIDSGLTFATEAEWEDYKKSSKSLNTGFGRMSGGGEASLFAFAEGEEEGDEKEADDWIKSKKPKSMMSFSERNAFPKDPAEKCTDLTPNLTNKTENDLFGSDWMEPKKPKSMMLFSETNAFQDDTARGSSDHVKKGSGDAIEAFHSSFQSFGSFGEAVEETINIKDDDDDRKKKASKKSVRKKKKEPKEPKASSTSRGRSSKSRDKEKSSKSKTKNRKKPSASKTSQSRSRSRDASELNSSSHDRSRSRDKSSSKAGSGMGQHRGKKKERSSRGRRSVDGDHQNADLNNRSGHNRSKYRETKSTKLSKESNGEDRGDASRRKSRRSLDVEEYSKHRDRSIRSRSGDKLGAFMDGERGEISVRRGRRGVDSADDRSLDLSAASGPVRLRRNNSRGNMADDSNNFMTQGSSDFETFANNSFAAGSFADPSGQTNKLSSGFEPFDGAGNVIDAPARGVERSKSDSGDFVFGEFNDQETPLSGLGQGERFFVESKSATSGPRLAPSRREVLRSRSADAAGLMGTMRSPGDPRRILKASGTGSGPNTPSAPPKAGLSGLSTPTSTRSDSLGISRHRQKGNATAANSWMAEVPGALVSQEIPQNSAMFELDIGDNTDCISPLTAATRKVAARPAIGRRRGGYR